MELRGLTSSTNTRIPGRSRFGRFETCCFHPHLRALGLRKCEIFLRLAVKVDGYEDKEILFSFGKLHTSLLYKVSRRPGRSNYTVKYPSELAGFVRTGCFPYESNIYMLFGAYVGVLVKGG